MSLFFKKAKWNSFFPGWNKTCCYTQNKALAHCHICIHVLTCLVTGFVVPYCSEAPKGGSPQRNSVSVIQQHTAPLTSMFCSVPHLMDTCWQPPDLFSPILPVGYHLQEQHTHPTISLSLQILGPISRTNSPKKTPSQFSLFTGLHGTSHHAWVKTPEYSKMLLFISHHNPMETHNSHPRPIPGILYNSRSLIGEDVYFSHEKEQRGRERL